jgi:hypothetical protein
LLCTLVKQTKDRMACLFGSRMYGAMVPYLNGIHLTLDSWQPNCDEDGWQTQVPLSKSVRSRNLKSLYGLSRWYPGYGKTLKSRGVHVHLWRFGVSMWVAGQGTLYTANGPWSKDTAGKSSNSWE